MCLASDLPRKINWDFYCAFSKLVSPGTTEWPLHWGVECLNRPQRGWASLQEIWHLSLSWQWFKNCAAKLTTLVFIFFCNYCHLQAEESAEQLSEELLDDLLEDTARVAWTVRTDRQLQGMAQDMLQAPTLESMLLRMEEIQVRGTHQWKVTMEFERSLVTGLVFIMSCYDSCGLRLTTDAFSRLDYTVQFVWQGSLSVGCCVYRIWFSVSLTAGSGRSEETVCFYHLFRPSLLETTRTSR